jgi:hypothetical protein
LIATQVLRAEDASLMTAAKTHARVGIAIRDAVVSCWSTKYRYNLVRPVTYLQRLIDPHWLSPLATPSFPEYTSGHSVQSSAAFGVVGGLFGDRYSFVDHTHDDRGLPAPTPLRQFHPGGPGGGDLAAARSHLLPPGRRARCRPGPLCRRRRNGAAVPSASPSDSNHNPNHKEQP